MFPRTSRPSRTALREGFHLEGIFTSTATGKSVELLASDQSSGNFHALVHEDGTFTFTTTYKGLTVLLKIPKGPTLSRDAGVITFADTFAANPPYGVISETVSGEKGPHPELADRSPQTSATSSSQL
jgi:hypothetical protein